MLTQKRAREVWAQRGVQNQVEHLLTQVELDYVRLVWDHMPGNTCWQDAFHLIRNAKHEAGPFQPCDFVTVKASCVHAPHRGLRGMIRSYIPFGKYYVYLKTPNAAPAYAINLCIVSQDALERGQPSNLEIVKLTGVTRDQCGWGTPNEVKPGDAVDDSVYWEMLEVVPPATHKADLMQMGETMDHNGAGDTPRYLTLQKHAERWIYTGIRVRGERVKLEI